MLSLRKRLLEKSKTLSSPSSKKTKKYGKLSYKLKPDRTNAVLEQLLHAAISRDIVEDELCRRNLAPFVKRVFETLVPSLKFKANWHVDLICEYLEAVHLGEIRRLIINLPPRFLKSQICSIAFPAWILGLHPNERILCGSYAGPLSIDLSVKSRRVMQTEWYKRTFPDTLFMPDQNEKSKFETTKMGYRVAVSVGGSVTGLGGTYKILDDPIDPQAGYSDAERKRVISWLDETWSSRNEDSKSTREVVIMQRIHTMDPTSHLLGQGGWELLKIPQEAPATVQVKYPRTGKEITRLKGTLIHPEYYGEKEVAEAKVRLGPYGYPAQHQQEPVPLGGGRIKLEWFPRFQHFPATKTVEETIISVDTANKKSELNNPSAILVFQRVEQLWHLVAVFKKRWSYPELKAGILGLDDQYHANTYIIEDKASGQSLIQDLKASTKLSIVPMEPDTDKVNRMEVQLSQLAAGRVALPSRDLHCSWMFEFEQNLMSYPAPMEWDELDALSQALKYFRQKELIKPKPVVAPFSVTQTSSWRDV